MWEDGGFVPWVPVLCPVDPDPSHSRSFYLRKDWPYDPLRPRVGHITPFLPDSESFSKSVSGELR